MTLADGVARALQSKGGWAAEAFEGTAGSLHALEVGPGRSLRVNFVQSPALVLGSSQPAPESPEVGLEVARRRSGGGAVYLAPAQQVWVDLVLGADDPLWVDDVGLSSAWVGDAWRSAVAAETDVPPEVFAGPMRDRRLGAVACFAGVGPGEVVAGGRKLVGVSQRRTRTHARFQTVAYLRWEPHLLATAMGGLPDAVRARLVEGVQAIAPPSTPLDRGTQWGVVERLVAALP